MSTYGKEFRKLGLVLAAVTETVVLTLCFFGLGYFLDAKLQSSPWGAVVFAFVGLIFGFYRLYQFALRSDQKDET